MTKKHYPEQRSATAQPQPGQVPAQPTGNEVYDTQASSQSVQSGAYTTARQEAEKPGGGRKAAARSPRTSSHPRPGRQEVLKDWMREHKAATMLLAFACGLAVGWMRPLTIR